MFIRPAPRECRVRLFESPLMERLTLIHPLTPYIFWTPVVALLFNTGPFSLVKILYIFAGVLFWTFAEYAIHRYLFHWRPRFQWDRRMIYLLHENHHLDPADPLRGVMPLMASVTLSTPIYLAGLFLTQFFQLLSLNFYHTFFGGFLVGYLLYDGIHFYTHHGRPKGGVGKFLKRYHLVHHKHAHLNYGISSPLWDLIFQTGNRVGSSGGSSGSGDKRSSS